jgi:hypothetical protein
LHQESSGTARPQHRRPLIWQASSVVVAALLISGGLAVAPLVKSPAQAAAEAEPPPASQILVKVERRALSHDVVMRGIVQSGPNLSLAAPSAILSGSPVVTGAPLSAGASLVSGTVLLEANGEPVFTMDWEFPPYRDISAGVIGPDVRQLQVTLADLGYPVTQTSTMDWQTQNALGRFYLDRGYKVPTQEGTSTSETRATQPSTVQSDKTKETGKADGPSVAKAVTTPYLPAESIITIPAASHKLSELKIAVGQTISAENSTVAVLDASAPVVTAALQPDVAKTLASGDNAALADDRNGRTYELKVQKVGTASEEVPGIGKGLRVDLTFVGETTEITPEGTTLRLTTHAGGTTDPVLAVPVTAIVTDSDGSCHLTLANGTNMPITTGDNVDGWVDVSPNQDGQISEGDEVVVGFQAAG